MDIDPHERKYDPLSMKDRTMTRHFWSISQGRRAHPLYGRVQTCRVPGKTPSASHKNVWHAFKADGTKLPGDFTTAEKAKAALEMAYVTKDDKPEPALPKPKKAAKRPLKTEKFRFQNGALLKYDATKHAYVHCYSSLYAETMEDAIRLYKASLERK